MPWWSRVRWANTIAALTVVAAAAIAVWPRAAAEPVVPPSTIEPLPARPASPSSRTATTPAPARARPRARREPSRAPQSPRRERRPRTIAPSPHSVVPATAPESAPRAASAPAAAVDGDEFGLR